jgi:hypothetical protein
MKVPRIQIIMSIFLMSGCVPYPHEETKIPQINVLVENNGIPVNAAKISFQSYPEYKEPVMLGVTGENGTLEFSGKSSAHLFKPLGDPGYNWSLYIENEGLYLTGYHRQGIGYGNQKLKLKCEINALKSGEKCSSEGN